MSKIKNEKRIFDELDLPVEHLESEEYDENNDETFGAATTEDWELAHEQLSALDNSFFDQKLINSKKETTSKNKSELDDDNELINNTLNTVASHFFNQVQHHELYPPQFHQNQIYHNQLANLANPIDSFNMFITQMVDNNQTHQNIEKSFLGNQINNLENGFSAVNNLTNNFAAVNLGVTSTPTQNNLVQVNTFLNNGQNSFFLPDNLNGSFEKNSLDGISETQNSLATTSQSWATAQTNLVESSDFDTINSNTSLNSRGLFSDAFERALITNNNDGLIKNTAKKNDLIKYFSDDLSKNKKKQKVLELGQIEGSLLNDVIKRMVAPEIFTEDLKKPEKYQQNNLKYGNNYRNQNQYNNYNRQKTATHIINPLNPAEMIENDLLLPRQNGFSKMNNYGMRNNKQFEKNNWNRTNKYPKQEFKGFMSNKELCWLKKIQNLQLECEDFYIQDYYFVNFQTKKIAAELKKKERKNDDDLSLPSLIIPDRSTMSDTNTECSSTKYVPPTFEGSLGKVRPTNGNFPKQMLDYSIKQDKTTENSEDSGVVPNGRSELNKFRRMLLDIERSTTRVLKIDHEDKRIAALPEEAKPARILERAKLCEELFTGLLTTEDNCHVNFQIANIRKGSMLIFKALKVFTDPFMKTVVISDLLRMNNFHYVVMQKDKTLYCLDYGQILIDAIKTIKNCDFKYLLKIADGLEDASIVAKFQCGQEIIEVLLNQYDHFNVTDNEQKLKWLAFLERVLEDVDDIPHLRKLCNDRITALTQQI